jgi:hypothetical protein
MIIYSHILPLLLLLFFIIPTYGQENHPGKSDLPVSLSFEKLAEWENATAKDEIGTRVYLRLKNNLECPIFFKAFDLNMDTDEIGVFYTVEVENKNIYMTDIPKGDSPLDVGSPSMRLDSGKSILFSVPKAHLIYNLGIKLDFSYEGEISDRENEHAVLYYSSNLPEEIQQDLGIAPDNIYRSHMGKIPARQNKKSTGTLVGTISFGKEKNRKFTDFSPETSITLNAKGRKNIVVSDKNGDYAPELSVGRYCLSSIQNKNGDNLSISRNQPRCFSVFENETARFDIRLSALSAESQSKKNSTDKVKNANKSTAKNIKKNLTKSMAYNDEVKLSEIENNKSSVKTLTTFLLFKPIKFLQELLSFDGHNEMKLPK